MDAGVSSKLALESLGVHDLAILVAITVITSYSIHYTKLYEVAMGTSLADRAWGADSAVYRVAGVLNVIGGWFFTAFSAFIAAALVAYLLNLNVSVMFPILLVTAFALIIKSSIAYSKKSKEGKAEDSLKKASYNFV